MTSSALFAIFWKKYFSRKMDLTSSHLRLCLFFFLRDFNFYPVNHILFGTKYLGMVKKTLHGQVIDKNYLKWKISLTNTVKIFFEIDIHLYRVFHYERMSENAAFSRYRVLKFKKNNSLFNINLLQVYCILMKL